MPFTTMKIANATIRNWMIAFTNMPTLSVAAPASCAALSVGNGPPRSVTNTFVKSTPPSKSPIGGIRMSFTSESTILPKAAPMTTPTARSMTLPRIANSLNSLSMVVPLWLVWWWGSAAEHPLDRLERVHVLLERVEILLDVADRRAELAGRAERAALLAGLLHDAFADVAHLRVRAPLRHAAADPSGGEDRDHGADASSSTDRRSSHQMSSFPSDAYTSAPNIGLGRMLAPEIG